MSHILTGLIRKQCPCVLLQAYNALITPAFTCSTKQPITFGESYTAKTKFTTKDVHEFSLISGDTNPIHLDETYAKQTQFGKPVVHGVLPLSLLTSILKQILPGQGTEVESVRSKFCAPLYVNEPFVATVKVVKIEGERICCELDCRTDTDKIIIEGQAWMTIQ